SGHNYSVTFQTINTGVINWLYLTAAVTVDNKVYDGTTAAKILTKSITGVISGDTVSLAQATANFSDKNVGNNKTVTVNAFVLSGADAGNYQVPSPVYTTANITAQALTLTADNKQVEYLQPNPTFTVTGAGFATGDTVASLSGTLVCTTTPVRVV